MTIGAAGGAGGAGATKVTGPDCAATTVRLIVICWSPTSVCCAVSAAVLKVIGSFLVLIRFGITGATSKLFGSKIFALSADIASTVVLSIKTIFKTYVPGSAKVIGVVVAKVPVNGCRPKKIHEPLISTKPTTSS